VHLLFIGVTEDDDLVVIGRPQGSVIELAKKPLGELKVPRSSSAKILLISR
jgi:hypothetical protein